MASNNESKEGDCIKVGRQWLKIDPDAKINKYQSEIYSPFSPNAEISDWNLDFNDETATTGEGHNDREELQLYSPFRTDDVNEEEKQFKILDYRNRNYNSLSSISIMYNYFFGNKKSKSKQCDMICKKGGAKLEENDNLSEEEDIAF